MMEDQKNKEFATQKWDSEVEKQKVLEQEEERKFYEELDKKNANYGGPKKRMFVKRPKKDV